MDEELGARLYTESNSQLIDIQMEISGVSQESVLYLDRYPLISSSMTLIAGSSAPSASLCMITSFVVQSTCLRDQMLSRKT